MKRIIVAGGRNFNDADRLKDELSAILTPYAKGNFDAGTFTMTYKVIFVCGYARGADTLAEEFARSRGIAVDPYPANWGDIEGKPAHEIKVGKNGKEYWTRAGHFRNQEMADNADVLVAFWDGKSTGTKDMIKRATLNRLETHIFYY